MRSSRAALLVSLSLFACGGDRDAQSGSTGSASGAGSETANTSTQSSSPSSSVDDSTTAGTPTSDDATAGSSDGTGDSTGGDDGPVTESPWGIASSASSSYGLGGWAAHIAETGIDWLRGLDNSDAIAKLDIADDAGLQVASILYWSSVDPPSFPVEDIAGWQAHVTDLVGLTQGRVGYWEVWNEPPNFSANKSPQDYATIVQAAYDAAKAVDLTVQIGIAAQSNNVNFLDQALVAGAAGHFDYVTVHPYELLDLVDRGFEAEFMAIVPTLRKMLAARDPDHVDVPIWFTEIGEPVDGNHTPEHQAATVVKAYTLALAQGVTRVHWFEGRDGDSGPFGLLDGEGNERPSFVAMTTLIEQLGGLPNYRGWVLLEDAHYGFVFDREGTQVMVAWARPGASVQLSLDAEVEVIDPLTGTSSASATPMLTASPLVLSGIADALVAEAETNRDLPLWWGGDFGDASEVSWSADAGAAGLHPLRVGTIGTIDGEPAMDAGEGASLAFAVDPSFLSYDTEPLTIEATLRRNAAGGAGFNVKYESIDGNGSTGSWYDVPGDDQWYVASWDVDDDQFVGKWGYHFSFDSDSTMYSQYSVQRVTVRKR